MLMATFILNKNQQHVFNFSSIVFNNSLQSTLESFACGTQFFLENQVLFSSQVRLSIYSSDCLFSTLTWSIAYFPCLIELSYHFEPFHGEYVACRDGGITVALLVESYNYCISIYRHSLSEIANFNSDIFKSIH